MSQTPLPPAMSDDPTLMSIGALSRATGVPPDTLRTWERRYGFPHPERTESGHRRYSVVTLRRLRLVVRVLELGHRPSTVLAADEAALRQLLAEAAVPPPATPSESPPIDDDSEAIEVWLGHVERYEGRAFERELRSSWAALGALPFLERRAGPFVTELGARWESGALGVRHEHFASERFREFLAQHWRPLSDAATGSAAVLATLPGEQHVLGLHMAALTLTLANMRVVFLGADAPPQEIVGAVEHHSAEAVALSASLAVDRDELCHQLAILRASLPGRVRIAVGGAGFDPPPEGVDHTPDFAALAAWAARR